MKKMKKKEVIQMIVSLLILFALIFIVSGAYKLLGDKTDVFATGETVEVASSEHWKLMNDADLTDDKVIDSYMVYSEGRLFKDVKVKGITYYKYDENVDSAKHKDDRFTRYSMTLDVVHPRRHFLVGEKRYFFSYGGNYGVPNEESFVWEITWSDGKSELMVSGDFTDEELDKIKKDVIDQDVKKKDFEKLDDPLGILK